MSARIPVGAVRPLVAALGRTGLSAARSVEVQRRATIAGTVLLRAPRGVRVQRHMTVEGDWLIPPGAAQDAALLYLHGGGYVVGSAKTHRSLAARIAHRVGVSTLTLDYRRAPEHRHPAALQDALAAYSALLADGIPAARIAVAGDSAGGGLALALAIALREQSVPAPSVLGMICPWLDLVPDLDGSRRPAPREPLLSRALLASWAAHYVGDADPSSPSISPLRGDLAGLPALVVHSAGDDLLLADTEHLLLATSDVPGGEVEHRGYAGLWHDFHAFGGMLAVADEAIDDFGGRLLTRLLGAMRGGAQSVSRTS